MNKTLKKTLSIILTILMIVTTIPFVFAADVSLVINMTDSYSDGWNGNAIQVGTVSGGEFTKIADVTFDEGSTATYEAAISDENVYAFRWTKGSFAEECSFSIVIGGVTVLEASDCNAYSPDDIFYVTCNHSFSDSICSICGLECGVDFAHTMNSDSECTSCGYVCSHSYTNHYCKTCGNAENGYYAGVCGAENINDAIWSLDSQGTLTISGTGKYNVEYLNAPWRAYESSIKDVVIEEGITNIRQGSFNELSNAVSLSIPSTVNEIGTYANNYFAEFKLAEGNSTYALIDGVLFNADKTELIMYPVRKADETYTVPAGVLILGNDSFSYSENLKTINISDDVTTINEYCFNDSSVETVNFGKNVNSIDFNAFCYSDIKNIVLPEKLTEMSSYMFYGCSYLENLVIGSNVISIENDIITYCHVLEAVHFTGTEAQWEAIAKPESETDKINTVPVHFGALEEKPGQDATCAVDGRTAGLYCAECNDYVTGDIIPATGECTDENSDNVCDVCNALLGAPEICVGGIYVDGSNYTDILGDADEGATAYYVSETNTLVLDGFSYEEEDYGITCDGSLNIEVKGENRIAASDGLNFYVSEDTVINIVGTGKLDIAADTNGIYADSDNEVSFEINIKDSVTLNIDSESDGMDIDGKKANKITVSENGTLNIEAISEGITVSETSESVEILVKDNGTLTADCENECIYIVDTENSFVTFTDNAKVSLVNNDEEGIYISALEGSTVKVSGSADVYIDVEEQGVQAETVIVDGGSLKAHSKKTYEGIVAADVTVNAGKLIVKSENNNAISAGSIKITGGTFVAGNDSAEFPVCTVAPDFSEYTSEHTVLASERPDSPCFVEYDSADADNYRVISIQCKHELDGNVCKKCGFECGVDCGHYLQEGAVCTICGSFVYAITHEPSEAEPYVELSDDTGASYQWYTVQENISEITDENAATVSYAWGESSYDKETGWTGIAYQENYNGQDFFTVELKEGESLTVEVTGDFFSGVGLYDYDTEKGVWKDAQEGATSYELTVESDGNYTFYTYVNSGVVTVKAYKTTAHKNAIDGETSAELKNPVIGNNHFCEVTFADGTTEISDAFEATHLHSFSKYEEVTAPECGKAGKEVASCDHGCGATDEKEIPALTHEPLEAVKENEVAPKCGVAGSYDLVVYCNLCSEELDRDTITVDALTHKDDDGDYLCDHGCGHEFPKPDTPDTPDEPTDEACDHLCHKDGILGFLWKIIRFFYRLFNIQQYCDCGILHYDAPLFG